MQTVRYLIIGGGIAGTTAAETIRAHDNEGTIAIISDEPHRLYSRIMLSKQNFFLGKLPFDSIWLKTEEWYRDHRIERIVGKRALNLDRVTRTITLNDGTAIRYEKLLIAIGGEPRHIEIPGQEPGDIAYLRNLDEAQVIIAATQTAKHGIAIGGGFISFELCEMMRLKSLDVTLVLREPHFWDMIFDESGSGLIESALEKNGVSIIRGVTCAGIRHTEGRRELILSDGKDIPFDLAVAGIGITSQNRWVQNAGIDVRAGIRTNEYMETNDPAVWAAGDAAEYFDPILGEYVQMGNWTSAQIQGRSAGSGMTGVKLPMRLVSSYTTFGFGTRIAFVGNVRPLGGDMITRFDSKAGTYIRFFLKDRRLIGAALINRTQDIGVISKLIERQIPLPTTDALKDPTIPLQKFLGA